MCLGQHLLATARTTAGERASLEEKEPSGADTAQDIATSNAYSEKRTLPHYENMLSLYLI